MSYRVTFWGVRGSIPTPGDHTARYGGNTPCVAVEGAGSGNAALLVLDAGTGIRELGSVLQERGPGEIDLLLSHTHWDHIQGFPFFAPFFAPGNTIRIWGPKQGDVDLEVILRQQMHPVVFPVPLDGLAAHLDVTHVGNEAVEVAGFNVRNIRLRHPGTTLGYRLDPLNGGPSLAYITDNELGTGGEYDVGPSWRAQLLRFLDGADVLVHDAMYSEGELERHRGWGHSSVNEAVALAREARVDRLILFHHRPEHSDADIDRLVHDAQEMATNSDHPLDVIAAAEGLALTL